MARTRSAESNKSQPLSPESAQMRCQAIGAEIGYPVEAVMLVLHALTEMSGKDGKVQHLEAQEICDQLIRSAAEAYGDRALNCMEGWQLSTSEDVGRIVEGLIAAGLAQQQSGDSIGEFDGVYDETDLVRRLADTGGVASPAAGVRKSRRSSTLIPRLAEAHFGEYGVESLSITQRTWPYRVRVELQRAIDQIFAGMNVSHFSSVRKEYTHSGLSLHEALTFSRHDNAMAVPTLYEEIDIGEDAPARCLKNALWLAHLCGDTPVPVAVLMASSENYGRVEGMKFEVAVPPVERASQIVDEFFRTMEKTIAESRSYRGKVLSLEEGEHYRGQSRGIVVHRLRSVERAQVILPARTLELLERNVINFVRQRQRLANVGMQTKKGLLFYGPPGTGKTHTIHYLAGALPGHTTLLITSEQAVLLPEYMTLARLLQPSLIVIEDADLMARNRDRRHGPCDEVLLNRLLNEMDGLREDAEVLFVLTTNRPEMLEPALAARPGRIDQAIEFPLPDAIGREKLIRLYSRGATLNDGLVHSIVGKSEGVSGAFIKELMRRSMQFAIERADLADISLEDVDRALEEMLFAGGTLNRSLLGATGETCASQNSAT